MKGINLSDFPPSLLGPTAAEGVAKLMKPAKPAPKRSKYRNKRVTTPEGTFDSKREYSRWQALRVMEMEKMIRDLRRQVAFPLHGPDRDIVVCKYVADFTYYEGGKFIVEDVKGHKTAMYRLKKKWMAAEHGVDIRET